MRGDAGLSPFTQSHGGASGPHSCRRKGKSPVAPPPPTPVLGFFVPRISTPLPITARLWHQTGPGVPASVCSFLLLPPWSLYVSSPGPHPPRTPVEGCRFHSPPWGGGPGGSTRKGLFSLDHKGTSLPHVQLGSASALCSLPPGLRTHLCAAGVTGWGPERPRQVVVTGENHRRWERRWPLTGGGR